MDGVSLDEFQRDANLGGIFRCLYLQVGIRIR